MLCFAYTFSKLVKNAYSSNAFVENYNHLINLMKAGIFLLEYRYDLRAGWSIFLRKYFILKYLFGKD